MALERSNPLPEGRYWYDAIGSRRELFEQWDDTSPKDAVKVITTIDHADETPPRTWYLFEVTEPTMWPQAALGFPNIAGPEIEHEDDTIQAPDLPPDPVDILTDVAESTTKGLGMLLLLIAGFYVFGKGK